MATWLCDGPTPQAMVGCEAVGMGTETDPPAGWIATDGGQFICCDCQASEAFRVWTEMGGQ